MDFTPPKLDSEEIVIAVDSSGIKVHNRRMDEGEVEEERMDRDSSHWR